MPRQNSSNGHGSFNHSNENEFVNNVVKHVNDLT